MPRRAPVLCFTVFVLNALVFGPGVVQGATLYVDGKIAPASCTTYAPASRSCSAGSDRAYRTLSGASAAAVAGDTVYLRDGTYSEQLVPSGSGTASQPITFAAFPSESPKISGVSDPALWLIQRSYIVIDGLTVTNVGGWGRLEDATYNIIRNSTFTAATIVGTTGGLKLVRSSYNKVLDSTFDDGNDNITIQESDRNVVQGNTISTARHSLLSLRCGNYNVVRGNTFSNPDEKDLEIYDCEGTSDAPVKLDATKRNLVEGNVIADSEPSSSDYDYNGIQFAGQQGIVRRNVFRDDMGGGINFQYYSDESLYNNRNRVYNNTFYNNRCYGIVGNSGDSTRYYDNRARNNILYKNTSCSGAATQTSVSAPSLVILSDNAILTTSPGFVDEAARNLQLASSSPMIDAAAFLTTATAAGAGTQITVADASYFFDGYGIPGELGDEIQLQGQTTVARVLAVDLATNRLTLDRSLSWAAGTGVALKYAGAKPDLGAYEFTGGAVSLQLTITRAGTGTGTVTSSPAGISCGATCSAGFSSGTVVTLSQAASAGSSFAGWSGACTGAGSCQVTMDAAKSVTATFNLVPVTYTLTVAKAGNGTGTVTSSPVGISCGATCSAGFSSGTVVTLSQTASAGSSFAGWSGACTGAGLCQVTMSAAKSVTASFNLVLVTDFYTLTPCRVVDTRNPAGLLGGPALGASTTRSFPVTSGVCGIPSTAVAVSVNVTAVQPAAKGYLTLYPGDAASVPLVSTINFTPGQARANNAIVLLATDGTGTVGVKNGSAGTVHFVLDVNGYFQ